MTEIIIAVISSTVLSSIVTSIINRKTTKIDNTEKDDINWMKRVEFLEQRLEKLEKLACYDSNCKTRK